MKSAGLMLCAALAAGSIYGQLTYERLLKAESEPQNWLTYSGSYNGWRYSKLDQINRVAELTELAIPPGNHLERLRGDRAGQHSIRINNQFRVCFRWESEDAHDVEIVDYH